MENNIPHFISFLLHAGLAGLTLIYQPSIKPLQPGDGIFIELQEGPTPQGQTLIPPVEQIQIQPIVKKEKPKRIIKPAPIKKMAQKQSAKVFTQAQESPIKAAPESAAVTPQNNPSPHIDFGTQDGIRDARQLQQKKGNQSPAYPAIDRINRRQGKVVVLGYINDSGRVQKIKLESSSGTRTMNYNALKAFSLYRFEKGQQGWVRMPFQYILKGPSKRIQNSRRRTDGRSIR